MATTEAASTAAVIHEVDAPKEHESEQQMVGAYPPNLYFESKRKILELVKLFSEHGYMSLEEVALAMDRSSELVISSEVTALKGQIRDLDEDVRAHRLVGELIDWEKGGVEADLTSERELVQESLVRIASLESQLKDARRTTLKLIAASRNGLATLKRVRDHLAAETYAAGALNPLVHDFRELTQLVQELHALAVVKVSAVPMSPLSR